MNKFSVVCYDFEPDSGGSLAPSRIAAPIIDGLRLADLVRDRFWGVAVTLVAPPSRHWLGQPKSGELGRAVVLDGSCGVAGCCGVMARVSIGESLVEWTDFFARGRPSLPEDLSFRFDRGQYEGAIAGIGDLVPVPWPWK